MRVHAFLVALVALVLNSSPVLVANAEDWQDCTTPKNMLRDLDHRIAACTHVIEYRVETAANRAMAYNRRGRSYIFRREYDRALADLNEAIRLEPKLAGAYLNRGLGYYFKRDDDRAIADFNEAIRLGPKYSANAADAYAYLGRGLTYEIVGRKGDAVSDYRKVLLLDPSDPSAAEALKRLGTKAF